MSVSNIAINAHKIAAAYLAWFVVTFLIVVLDLRFEFLSTDAQNFFARYPFAIDYELMFTILFGVWAYFLWIDKRLVLFSGVAFLSQAIAMVILAVGNVDTAHLLRDMIPWLLLGILLVYSS